ncbi:MAG: hypothetical protein ACTSRP_01870 [Candidatus Helarchaeota archaeon]
MQYHNLYMALKDKIKREDLRHIADVIKEIDNNLNYIHEKLDEHFDGGYDEVILHVIATLKEFGLPKRKLLYDSILRYMDDKFYSKYVIMYLAFVYSLKNKEIKLEDGLKKYLEMFVVLVLSVGSLADTPDLILETFRGVQSFIKDNSTNKLESSFRYYEVIMKLANQLLEKYYNQSKEVH